MKNVEKMKYVETVKNEKYEICENCRKWKIRIREFAENLEKII